LPEKSWSLAVLVVLWCLYQLCEYFATVALWSWLLAWRSEVGRRASFFAQLSFMCINDAIWVVFWLLVFSHRDSIRGWERHEVLVLFSIVTASYGIGIGLFYGVRRLGERIHRNELDPYLAQPQPVVVRVLFSRIHPPLLGDLAFGPILFALAGSHDLLEWLRYVLVIALAGSIVVAFILGWESLAFFVSSGSEVAGLAFTAITVMSTYPAAIFSGWTKLIVFTVVPAAFVGSVPAHFVLEPTGRELLALAAATAACWLAALAMFHAGLRRYLRAA
jgi:ABC-2 type transport system permease protein